MNSTEILEFIYRKRDSKTKLGLDRIKKLLNYFDNPQDNLKYIHIAGTNGKGSTTTMIANILKVSGYKVGKFISPFIVDFTERIQINDKYISKEDVKSLIKKMSPIINKMEEEGDAPSSFEIITAMAFIYYKESNCDIVCLEVGMGGRFDATNVIKDTLVSVITLIDYDHMEYLGDTIEKIAFEKCGIIKNNSNVVCYPLQRKEALEVIKEESKKKNSEVFIPNMECLKDINDNKFKYSFKYKESKYNLNLVGEYQIYNAITAIEAINTLNKLGFNIKQKNITKGINTANFPARLEILSNEPLVVIDGSHNISGALTVKDFVERLSYKRNIGIIGMIDGKEHEKVLKILAPLFYKIIIVPVSKNTGEKNIETENKIFDIAKKYNNNVEFCSDYIEAYTIAKNVESVDSIIVTGSLYLASEYRKILIAK